MTPLDQLRLRLTDHDFERLMQAAKPVPVSDRDAFLRDVAAELGQHEVVGPGLLHRVISEGSGAISHRGSALPAKPHRERSGKRRSWATSELRRLCN